MKKNLFQFILWMLLLAAIVYLGTSCTKEKNKTGSSGSSSVSSSLLEIKLEGWYNNDSLLFSQDHPLGSIKQGYTKLPVTWYSYNGPQTGMLNNITVQQTCTNLFLQDSIAITIYVNGYVIKQASGKKLVLTSYTY